MNQGEVVRVVIVPKQHAKDIKTILEQHQLLHRNFRISNVVVPNPIDTNDEDLDGAKFEKYETTNMPSSSSSSMVAIPIWDYASKSSTPSMTDTNPVNTLGEDTENHVAVLVSDIITTALINTKDVIPSQPQIPNRLEFHFGYQFCPYSSRILGNHQNHPPSSLSLCNGRKSNRYKFTIIQSILIRAISQFLLQNATQYPTADNIQNQDGTTNSIANHEDKAPCNSTQCTNTTLDVGIWESLFNDVIECLSTDSCPSKLEVVGDDQTIVLPRKAFQYCSPSKKICTDTIDDACHVTHTDDNNDLDNCSASKIISFAELLQRYDMTSDEMVITFLNNYLWCDMAQTLHSRRIVRRNEIHPDSPIRQSNYQIVWYDPKYYSSVDNRVDNAASMNPIIDHSTAQNESQILLPSCNWITVTEHGIRQSFDMTKVMFCRGNITEKIRYGTQLVQKDDVVLDMYAGIGYFTLPALIHGQAKHVYCCEWNPDAILALRYNLQDNHVADRTTIFEGDCRVTIQNEASVLQNRFDRICLGLLPSSEGGWSSAILALRKDIGGWLHIHGNVPHKEVHQWSQWLSQSLKTFLLDTAKRNDTILMGNDRKFDDFRDWIVLVVHVEKVKSFAPNVNHYVADVFVGPCHCFPAKNGWPSNLRKESFQQYLIDNQGNGCMAGVVNPDKRCIELCLTINIPPPSCALSPNGPLHQAWMSSS